MGQPAFLKDQHLADAHSAVREYMRTRSSQPKVGIVTFGRTMPWVTQSEIELHTGVKGVTMRQVCQAYPATFVSSTEGYKLAMYSTRREIQHCVAVLMQRSERMLHRAQALSGRLA